MDRGIGDPARMFNPIIRGWMNYYGRYYKSALYPTLRHLDRCLARWRCRSTNVCGDIEDGQSTGYGTWLAAPPRC
ncbi:group II intron maturase-specific domain-containing protein [Bradyrhizobium agreste]|uniref:group II intron maturase-specific domain-containing protein n=1 Tax=Bradyrhizobium agreste TaxID=2751811 RepID=UPI00289CFC1D|nr:group II intron maturase-specific domain-containing protein [Bradyrhizobium agreste]